MRLLVTGATGNVGSAVLAKLYDADLELYAGVRDIDKATTKLGDAYQYCQLDFEKEIYPSVRFDAVFLVRPPQLAKASVFQTFLESLEPTTKIVFLSVQGADKKAYLPHAKIEKLIVDLGFNHVFIRPSYFMENLTTTLWQELKEHQRIFLPSADLKFNWIAVADVAEVAAIALTQPLKYEARELSNTTSHGFQEVVDLINTSCGTKLRYESPSLLRYLFYALKRRQGFGYTFIMLLLHYLPRFSKESNSTFHFKELTGTEPTSLETFIKGNCEQFKKI